jgi:bifunctional non-homologous end joining protein LigD
MGLQVYRKKRKFDVTPEPRGHAARGKGNRFVIQKHAARRLHYDLRLELDGVMKSWAVTRGPSLVPGEKRLAVHVEDHPIEYNSFEGTIPQGEYGGGTVMIWDRGHWYPEGDPHKGYQKGHLDFTLAGEKLHGRWHLVRMRRKSGESKEPWLLLKARDEEARPEDAPDILEEAPLSVVSGRSIAEIARGKGRKRVWHSNRSPRENVKAGATRGVATAKKDNGKGSNKRGKDEKSQPRDGRLPDFVPPSLATLRADAPSGDGWVHEIKFDGYRIQARLDRGKVRLLTRKGLDWTGRFPNIAAAVGTLPARSALIDGEVVVEDGHGVSSFSGLQAALKAGEQNAFIYYAFDLLHRDGRDLAGLPLVERKAELARLLGKDQRGTIRMSEHFEESGAVVLRHACAMGLEGIVSKLRDAPYCSGRCAAFIKAKCAHAQEFVVGGLFALDGARQRGRCPGGRLLRALPPDLCRAHRHRLHPEGGARSLEATARSGDGKATLRSNPARGSAPPRHLLGRAEDGDRIAISRLDRGWPRAPGCIQGRARGQAAAGSRSRGARGPSPQPSPRKNSGLSEFVTIKRRKSDKSDFGYGRRNPADCGGTGESGGHKILGRPTERTEQWRRAFHAP